MKAKYVKERQLNSKTVWVFSTTKEVAASRKADFKDLIILMKRVSILTLYIKAYIDFCISAEGKIYVDERTVGGLIHYYKTTRHYCGKRLRESSKTSYDLAFKKIFSSPTLQGM